METLEDRLERNHKLLVWVWVLSVGFAAFCLGLLVGIQLTR